MAKYRLMEKDATGTKVGDHYCHEKRYVPGSVIDSDKPLDKIFRNKFERVPDETPLTKPEIVPIISSVQAPIPVPNDVRAAVAKGVAEVTRPQTPAAPPSNPPETEEGSEPVGKDHEKYGKNVTHKFVDAATAGLNVFQKGDKFRVADPKGVAVSKKLDSEDQVVAFLKKQIEE